MKTDLNGVSTCPTCKEQWETFTMPAGRNGKLKKFVQYEYRFEDGTLFTCVKPTLAECREARDKRKAEIDDEMRFITEYPLTYKEAFKS